MKPIEHPVVLFPNYTQLESRLPLPAWHGLRILSVATALTLAALLIVRPQLGLPLFWNIAVPLLPALFLFAPGLWRNLCPMAALNQTPRLFGFTRGLAHTPLIREYSYVVGIVLFFALVSSRRWLFDHSGLASGLLVLGGLGFAFVGGLVFKGKSGWCSSICPMLPVQRLYGQTPFALVKNTHCQPCVGCTKNCYDFNPGVAYLADQYDDDRRYSGYRRLFAGLLPGFILAFFTVPPAAPLADLYGHFALYAGLSLALFHLFDTFLKVPLNRLTVLFGAVAFNTYYWFAANSLAGGIGTLSGTAPSEALPWMVRTVIIATSLVWLWRSFIRENLFREQTTERQIQVSAKLGAGAAEALRQADEAAQVELVIEPEQRRVPAQAGQTLLEVIEGCGARIEAGCRMGVCGADPVAVKDGMDNLSEIGHDEANTLERLGYAPNTRMACCARMRHGSVAVALQPDKATAGHAPTVTDFDREIKEVVIVGNGIAGVTAADHVRRRHPECAIRVIADENHALYNRMGISRLIYGRSAMQGLYLNPDNWYADRNIDIWLNTAALRIDPAAQTVDLADGESLHYDRLILANGSQGMVPPLPGWGGTGCFVLRTANDAMTLRSYAQRIGARHAVVAGGGLLGLEGAYALHKFGLKVTVVERNAWLLHRQLDERAGQLLQRYLQSLGLEILTNVQLDHVTQEDGQALLLADGSRLPAEVLVVAAGIVPNIELAREAGLTVQRGVVVDEYMRSSDPAIFAAGDIAEHQGRIPGLWPVAVEQAEVAAANAMGEPRAYNEPVLSTMLKVVGADVYSVGRFDASEGDQAIADEDPGAHRYRKVVFHGETPVGAILVGWPELVEPVSKAVKAGQLEADKREALLGGDWSVLANG